MRRFKSSGSQSGWRNSPSARRRNRADRSESPQAGSDDADKKPDAATEIAAVRLLARREHSTRELQRKLQHRGHAPETVHRVVDKLASQKLVSDERFARSFVAHHGRRGQGPVRIRAELREQGAPEAIIEAALAEAEFDWAALAREVRVRKFGEGAPNSLAERAKQARFLQYRGFNADQIRAALSGSVASVDDFECSDPSGFE